MDTLVSFGKEWDNTVVDAERWTCNAAYKIKGSWQR